MKQNKKPPIFSKEVMSLFYRRSQASTSVSGLSRCYGTSLAYRLASQSFPAKSCKSLAQYSAMRDKEDLLHFLMSQEKVIMMEKLDSNNDFQ